MSRIQWKFVVKIMRIRNARWNCCNQLLASELKNTREKKIIHTFIERKHIIIDQHHNYINSASMQREKEKNNSRIILNK